MTAHSRPGRKWTYDDYATIPPDLLRHEIIEGEHYTSAAPGVYHQEVLGEIFVQLYRLVTELGFGGSQPTNGRAETDR